MANTLRTLRKLPVKQNAEDIAIFINRELIPFLNELKGVLDEETGEGVDLTEEVEAIQNAPVITTSATPAFNGEFVATSSDEIEVVNTPGQTLWQLTQRFRQRLDNLSPYFPQDGQDGQEGIQGRQGIQGPPGNPVNPPILNEPENRDSETVVFPPNNITKPGMTWLMTLGSNQAPLTLPSGFAHFDNLAITLTANVNITGIILTDVSVPPDGFQFQLVLRDQSGGSAPGWALSITDGGPVIQSIRTPGQVQGTVPGPDYIMQSEEECCVFTYTNQAGIQAWRITSGTAGQAIDGVIAVAAGNGSTRTATFNPLVAGAGLTIDGTNSILAVGSSTSIAVNANDIQRPALTGDVEAALNSNTLTLSRAIRSLIQNAPRIENYPDNVDTPFVYVPPVTFPEPAYAIVQTDTSTGTVNNFALNDDTDVLLWNGASAVTYTGFVGGREGRLLWVRRASGATGDLNFADEVTSSLTNRLAMPSAVDYADRAQSLHPFIYISSRWRSMRARDSGRLINVQVLTTAAASPYVPGVNVASFIVEMWGGSGGGGGAATTTINHSACGASGSSGVYGKWYVVPAAGASYTYTIGTAGTAGAAAGGTAGGSGGSSTFGAATCNGGAGGSGSGTATTGSGSGAAGGRYSLPLGTGSATGPSGSPAGGSLMRFGANLGDVGVCSSATIAWGGASVPGGDGSGSHNATSRVVAVNTSVAGVAAGAGSGASGGGASASSNGATAVITAAGGAGAIGMIIIYEYS